MACGYKCCSPILRKSLNPNLFSALNLSTLNPSTLEPLTFKPSTLQPLLGGSWVLISRVAMAINFLRALKTLLVSAQEPPSKP